MDLKQVIDLIKKTQGQETQKDFAERIGISPQYLNDVLLGKREPGEGILKPMGIVKKVSYEKEEPYATEIRGVAEQVDAPDFKSDGKKIRAGSTPASPTNQRKTEPTDPRIDTSDEYNQS